MESKIKTFEDLIEYNLKFLNGEIKETFYHCGPVDEETIPLLDNLKKINRFGFLSINGQPGLLEYDIYSDYVSNYVDTEQKSWIEGYMIFGLNSIKLELFLSKNPDIYYNCCVYPLGTYNTNLPSEYYNITREREKGEKWNEYTNIPNEYIEIDTDYDNINKILLETHNFNITFKEFGPQNSVEKLLIDFFGTL